MIVAEDGTGDACERPLAAPTFTRKSKGPD
jgi:hypothetical protein